jgi:hypothetical protein
MRIISTLLITICISLSQAVAADEASTYLAKKDRKVSPGNTAYYIDPSGGDDANSGLKKSSAWRSFKGVNQLFLSAGDSVNIISSGSFEHTLMLMGTGSLKAPVQVRFAPGRYDLSPAKALRRKYQISNTNSQPDTPKAIGILLDGAKHFQLSGTGARIVYRGKMIELCIDRSENITVSDLKFDYHRPTVSEFTVSAIGKDYVDLKIHKDSWYKIENGQLLWVGEGWTGGLGLGQELVLDTNRIWRRSDPLKGLKLEEIGKFMVRGRGRHNLKKGRVYQTRVTTRDCAGVFTRRSKNILWKNVNFYFLHGMGIVSQFTENITFDTVSIAPDKKSGRTCAAWADMIHCSGCRGKVVVKNCTFSGAHDDAMNVHGTYLRVVERVSDKQIKVKFMHRQTFGFMAFNAGDDVEFVKTDSLKAYAPNKVESARLLNPKELLLTLKKPVPKDVKENHNVENVTWTPEVEVSGCKVSRIPTRGFLLTTRRKVLVTDNDFMGTNMSAILIESDASGWFESGCVRDMTICKNRFIRCGEPVIKIDPKNRLAGAVHKNILIKGNEFVLRRPTSVRANSTEGLSIIGNTIYLNQGTDEKKTIQTGDCSKITLDANRFLPSSQWTNR